MENRKNTILLTVIAVATLLVAVVGATFAYFTAQGGTSVNAAVEVQTYKTSTGSFNLDGAALTINETQQNFVENGKSLTDVGTATAMFTGATGTGESEGNVAQDFCYTVGLEVQNNGFITNYTDAPTNSVTVAAANPGVLLFNASVNDGATDHELDNSGSMDGATWTAATSGYSTTTAGTTTSFSGYDIIALSQATYPIVINGASETAGTVSIYKLTSDGTATDTHTWDFDLTLVNTESNQNSLTGANGIEFKARIVFSQVSCTDGSAVSSD